MIQSAAAKYCQDRPRLSCLGLSTLAPCKIQNYTQNSSFYIHTWPSSDLCERSHRSLSPHKITLLSACRSTCCIRSCKVSIGRHLVTLSVCYLFNIPVFVICILLKLYTVSHFIVMLAEGCFSVITPFLPPRIVSLA